MIEGCESVLSFTINGIVAICWRFPFAVQDVSPAEIPKRRSRRLIDGHCYVTVGHGAALDRAVSTRSEPQSPPPPPITVLPPLGSWWRWPCISTPVGWQPLRPRRRRRPPIAAAAARRAIPSVNVKRRRRRRRRRRQRPNNNRSLAKRSVRGSGRV